MNGRPAGQCRLARLSKRSPRCNMRINSPRRKSPKVGAQGRANRSVSTQGPHSAKATPSSETEGTAEGCGHVAAKSLASTELLWATKTPEDRKDTKYSQWASNVRSPVKSWSANPWHCVSIKGIEASGAQSPVCTEIISPPSNVATPNSTTPVRDPPSKSRTCSGTSGHRC
jgi:hypothetical protein